MFSRFPLQLVVTLFVIGVTFVNGASTNPSRLLLNGLLQIQSQNNAKHVKRQANGVGLSVNSFPEQCRNGCKVAIDTLNTCLTPSCLCTNAVEHSLDDCINCTVEVLPDPEIIKDGQQVFSTFNALCAGTGVESLTITAAAAAAISGSNTATASGSSTSTSSILNPFAVSDWTTTSLALGPHTTIRPTSTFEATMTTSTTTSTSKAGGLPIAGNDAVSLPRASGTYVAVGIVVAFFMCLL